MYSELNMKYLYDDLQSSSLFPFHWCNGYAVWYGHGHLVKQKSLHSLRHYTTFMRKRRCNDEMTSVKWFNDSAFMLHRYLSHYVLKAFIQFQKDSILHYPAVQNRIMAAIKMVSFCSFRNWNVWCLYTLNVWKFHNSYNGGRKSDLIEASKFFSQFI